MPIRSFFRLRLRVLLVLIALVALLLGGILEHQRRERRWLQMRDELSAAAIAGDAGRIRRLLDEGVDVDAITEGRSAWTPLMHTAFEGHLEASRILIDCGADVNRQDRDLTPPINIAAFMGRWDVVRLLVEHGADTSIVDPTCKSPLDHARARGATDMVRYLENHAGPARE